MTSIEQSHENRLPWIQTVDGALNATYVERLEVFDDNGDFSVGAWVRNTRHHVRRMMAKAEAWALVAELTVDLSVTL